VLEPVPGKVLAWAQELVLGQALGLGQEQVLERVLERHSQRSDPR